MQISSNISDEELKLLQQQFYEYFDTGYAFEGFLKEYLLQMGLDEVEVTKRSRDGGVDLNAIRKGFGDFSNVDITNYYVQAKCYKLNHKVNVHDIRELKGIIPFGHKGVLITTSSCTKDAIEESRNDPSKPVVIIDGKSLVTSCIDNEIGFLYKPIFSTSQMNLFLHKHESATVDRVNVCFDSSTNYIEKTITSNDIRARIVSIPSSIMKQFAEEQSSVQIKVNNEKIYQVSINRSRNYFGGVTSFLRDYNMISDEGVITQKQCKWFYNEEELTVFLYIED